MKFNNLKNVNQKKVIRQAIDPEVLNNHNYVNHEYFTLNVIMYGSQGEIRDEKDWFAKFGTSRNPEILLPDKNYKAAIFSF